MPSPHHITAAQLLRRIGLPDAPLVVDVRTDDDAARDPRLVPAASRRDWSCPETWAAECAGRAVVVLCQHGRKLSEGAAAWLRHAGHAAEVLEGGFAAWAATPDAPLLKPDHLPARDRLGRTLWVTRSRPKVDRIACPWLIRRFVDPRAVFLYVAASEVAAVAARFGATPFDIEGVTFSHQGPRCTFDTMLGVFGLTTAPLLTLAAIIRGADTDALDLTPQSAGLLAASLGLSRMHRDDLAQLDAGLALYDAFYRWCRDATAETHAWVASAHGV